jgi:hypothetical protein
MFHLTGAWYWFIAVKHKKREKIFATLAGPLKEDNVLA